MRSGGALPPFGERFRLGAISDVRKGDLKAATLRLSSRQRPYEKSLSFTSGQTRVRTAVFSRVPVVVRVRSVMRAYTRPSASRRNSSSFP